jgi:type I restriction enzyme S subunit
MMPAGRAILCPNHERKYVLSSDAVKFHVIKGIDFRYILNAINSDMFKQQVYENVQGVTRVRTSLQKLRKYYLPIPPQLEQFRIVSKIGELYAVLDRIEEFTKD